MIWTSVARFSANKAAVALFHKSVEYSPPVLEANR